MGIMDSGQQITVESKPSNFHTLPDSWQLCSMGEITISSQYGISSSLGGNFSVPILKMNNLQDGHIDLRGLGYIQLSKAEMESLLLNKGDLLINRTNSIDLVGKAAIYDLEGKHIFASYLVRFRLRPFVVPEFVNYFLNSAPGQSKLKLLATKAVSQANINPSTLKSRLLVPIPPLPEQHAIATALSDVDALITSLDKLIAKKRDIKQATMQQLLTGKTRLPGFSKELKPVYKQTDFGMVPTDWEPMSLDSFSAFITKGATPTTYGFSWVKDGVLFLRSECVSEQGLDLTQSMFITPEAHSFLRRGEVRAGDILITITGNVGRVVYLNNGFGIANINQHIARIRILDANVDADYVFHFLSHPMVRKYYNSIVTGQAYPQISLKQVRDTRIPVPPTKSEQQAIATVLSDMDAEIAALEQKRKKTRMLKQGMMQELLTGKIRLV